MESLVDQCHLLRISRELRYCIYDHVIHFDPPTDTVWDYKGHTTFVKTPGTNFSIPWVDLLSTCKAINEEINAFVDIQSNIDKEGHRTWILELAASGSRLQPVLWRQIPCVPAKAEVLIANLKFTETTYFWGDGGPRPILAKLYQTLNQTLHYGPALGRQVPLEEPLKLKTLVLRAATGTSYEGYKWLCRFVETLKGVGILWGYIGTIQIIHEGSGEKRDFVMEFVENSRVPNGWSEYGFKWGVIESKDK